MSFVQPSSIQLLAESLAVPKLSSDSAKALAPHIDVRLREVVQARFTSLGLQRITTFCAGLQRSLVGDIAKPAVLTQEACKFSRHSKRTTLTTEDINNALRLRNVEVGNFLPLVDAWCGSKVISAVQFRTLATLYLSLQPLYGFGGKDPARFVRAAGHADLFYVQDLDTPTGQASACHAPCLKVLYMSDQFSKRSPVDHRGWAAKVPG